jgi:hypothetical protein
MTRDSLPPTAGRPAEFQHDIRLFLGNWQNVGIENPIGEVTSTGLSKIPGEWIVSWARTISHWLLPSADATARVVIYETGVWPSGEIESLWWNVVDSDRRFKIDDDSVVEVWGASQADRASFVSRVAL